MANLLVEKEADRVVALVERAGRDGYNGVVISDYKLNFLERMPKQYFEHVARVKQAAERANVEIIPAVFPIGYSNGLLSNDTNLAEGMPVENAPVRRQRARGGARPRSGGANLATAIWRRPAATSSSASATRTHPARRPSPTARSSTTARSPAGCRTSPPRPSAA